MKCIDCGADAVLIADMGNYLKFAYCKECVRNRTKMKFGIFENQLNEDDIWESLGEPNDTR